MSPGTGRTESAGHWGGGRLATRAAGPGSMRGMGSGVVTRAQALANAEVYRSLGVRMQALRQAKGWSRAVLARRVRLSVSTVAKYERGAARAVDLLHLRDIAAELGTTAGALLDATPGPVVISEEAADAVLAASHATGLTAAAVIELAVEQWAPPSPDRLALPDDDRVTRVTGPGLHAFAHFGSHDGGPADDADSDAPHGAGTP